MFARVRSLLAYEPPAEVAENAAGTGLPDAPTGSPSESLLAAFTKIETECRQLGDIAEIFSGICPRDRRSRRYASPGRDYRPVLSEGSVSKFRIGNDRIYLPLSRKELVRMPAREEYDQPEKVVLKRRGLPIVAAVDRSRYPLAAGLYAIVPVRGLSCGYLACVLNSRLIDFYSRRIRLLQNEDDYLRREDLERIPIPIPDPKTQAKFSGLQRSLRRAAPSNHRQPLRADYTSLLRQMNVGILRLYGLSRAAVREIHATAF